MPACIHGISPLGACSICTPPSPPDRERHVSDHRHFTYKTANGYRSPFMWPSREAAEKHALQASPDGTATVFEVPNAREDPADGSTE